jgi:hypothetical protein
MLRSALLVICATACGEPQPARVGASSDSAYGLVQERGHAAMGVDQYTSTHRFESLPDGGRITLERDSDDLAGVAQIRSHMEKIAAAFQAGDFSIPGFVHDREVPGTGVMRARRGHIRYTPSATPAGGQLRILSRDPQAIAAIHQFLAFQRRDHRSEAAGDSP